MLRAKGIIATTGLRKGILVDVESIEVGEHIPILDSHSTRNGCLGHVERAWIEDGALWGDLVFTGRAGRRAYRSIERQELNGVSCSFWIETVAICDGDGNEVGIEEALERGHADPDLTVVALRSILREVSICAAPSDAEAFVRATGFNAQCWAMIRQGEEELRRILHPDHDDDDGDNVDDGDMTIAEMLAGGGQRSPRAVLHRTDGSIV